MTTTRIRFRAALAATALAPVLLAGCASPAAAGGDDPVPVEPDGGTGTTDPLSLDYPPLTDPETAVPEWRRLSESISGQLAAWDAQCEPADASLGTPCTAALVAIRMTVGEAYQQWWALDDSSWESGEYSGLVALEATLAARESGAGWESACGLYAQPADCTAAATAFHDDLTALDAAFTAWRG